MTSKILTNLTAADALEGDELMYTVQDGNSRQVTIDTVGARAFEAYPEVMRDSLKFTKGDYSSVAFTLPTTQTVSIKAGCAAYVNGVVVSWSSNTAVTLPTLTAGTDYYIYVCSDGSLVASSNSSAPSGYTTTNSKLLGGVHYAPGSNAAAQAGGDAIPQFNPYSLWDLRWRAKCRDNRGMTLVNNMFWCDIYLCGMNTDTNGTSKYGVTIADGGNLPKIPALYGGDGTTSYTTFDYYVATDIMSAAGKRLLDYQDFSAAAYGATGPAARGTDPVTTGLSTTNTGTNADHLFTSKWGVVQASGCGWIKGMGHGSTGVSGWSATGGRGSAYAVPYTVLFGGGWVDTSYSGSRCSYWAQVPSYSGADCTARGRCDHLIIS